MSGLFRAEAMASERHRLLGDVILAQPLSFVVMTLFLGGIVVAIGVLITLGSYARKETVIGFLTPDRGIVRVHAPRAGVVGTLHVGEGQDVRQGSPLITLLGDRTTGAGVAVDDEMLRSIEVQLGEIEAQKNLQTRRFETEARRLAAELTGLEAEAGAIDAQLASQGDLLGRMRENFTRVQSIAERGFISRDAFLAREEDLLAKRQQLGISNGRRRPMRAAAARPRWRSSGCRSTARIACRN